MTVLDESKLKNFADDKFVSPQMMKFVLDRFDNIVRKGENDGYIMKRVKQHFLFAV